MVRGREDVEGVDSSIITHPAHLGSLGPRRALQRPDGRLQSRARSASAPTSSTTLRKCTEAQGPASTTSPSRGNFNLMLSTQIGASCRCRLHRLPAGRRPASSIFNDFKRVRGILAAEDALRHRADRQGLPQRDQPSQLHLPLSRVRAGRDGVLLPSRFQRASGSNTGSSSASPSTGRSASPTPTFVPDPTRPTSWRTTRTPPRTRVPVPLRLAGDRGHPRSRFEWDLSRNTASTRARTCPCITDEETKEHYTFRAVDRDVRGHRSHHPGGAVQRPTQVEVLEGGDEPHRVVACHPASGARSRWRCCPCRRSSPSPPTPVARRSCGSRFNVFYDEAGQHRPTLSPDG